MEHSARLLRPVRALALPLLGFAALSLGGCGDSERVTQLEQRLANVEAKADAAEKRAKAAESFAARNAPQPFPADNGDTGPSVDLDPDANQVTDDSANDPSFNYDVAPPRAPLIPGDA
ncbi:MAG: hypothetical protein RIS94_2299 [Pseudomonadota bacterium]